jgi:uncharacterized membrane protein YeaQ/YmgE (transglycosylase-associated protein family)
MRSALIIVQHTAVEDDRASHPQPTNCTAMPQRIGNALEIICSISTATFAAISKIVMATIAPEEIDMIRWLLLPIVGASLASLVAFLLNPFPENRKVVSGRVLGALVLSISGAWITSALFPSFKAVVDDPRTIVLVSFLTALVIYFLIKPLVEGMARRSAAAAKVLLDAGEARLGVPKDRTAGDNM